jgi:hypothetical protein
LGGSYDVWLKEKRMWFEIIFGLAICYLGFMYLRQITTWTLPSFQQGLVVRKYQEPFPGHIPNELLKQEIVCKNIIFKFDTPRTGLFRAYPRFAFFKNRRTSYFPSLLGEIEFTSKGIAFITLRFPLSIVLILLVLFVALIISNAEGIFTINSVIGSITKVVLVLFLFAVFSILGFVMEKDDLHDAVIMLKEYANSNSSRD